MGELLAISSETDLIDRAYAAALDDSLWEGWARDLIFTLGGAGGTFMVWDENATITRSYSYAIDADAQQAPPVDWWARNPDESPATAMTRPGLYVDTEHLDSGGPMSTARRRWQLAGSDWHHHMSGVALLGEGGARATITVHRTREDGPPTPRDQDRFAAILPDMTRAMNLGFHASRTLLDSFWDGVQARQGARSALLIDERGHVMRLTSGAEALLGQGRELHVTGKRLSSRQPADDAQLAAVIEAAIAPSDARSGVVRIARAGGQSSLMAIAYPLARSRRVLAPAEPAALVSIVDLGAADPGHYALYRQSFGFTHREAETAQALMQGHSVESAAACLGLSVPTARIHVRRLLEKTGTARQSELIRILSVIG